MVINKNNIEELVFFVSSSNNLFKFVKSINYTNSYNIFSLTENTTIEPTLYDYNLNRINDLYERGIITLQNNNIPTISLSKEEQQWFDKMLNKYDSK